MCSQLNQAGLAPSKSPGWLSRSAGHNFFKNRPTCASLKLDAIGARWCHVVVQYHGRAVWGHTLPRGIVLVVKIRRTNTVRPGEK